VLDGDCPGRVPVPVPEYALLGETILGGKVGIGSGGKMGGDLRSNVAVSDGDGYTDWTGEVIETVGLRGRYCFGMAGTGWASE
jgi:hypothetical protein